MKTDALLSQACEDTNKVYTGLCQRASVLYNRVQESVKGIPTYYSADATSVAGESLFKVAARDLEAYRQTLLDLEAAFVAHKLALKHLRDFRERKGP